MRKKPFRCDRRKRSLGLGSLLRGFRVRSRVNNRAGPENAGDGRFGGVAPRQGPNQQALKDTATQATKGLY